MEALKFLVKDQWRSSGATRGVVNPYTGGVVETVYQAASRDIEDAIAAAHEAASHARSVSSYDRSVALAGVSQEVDRRRDEFARLITLETGKPLTFSRVEVDRSVFTLQTASEEAKRLEGEILPLDAAPMSQGRIGIVRRFPLGVIGAITPFNFPLNLVCHKLGPAIGSGNTVVLKPSSNAPGVSLLLGEIVARTGLPAGTLNIVPCAGADASQLIVDKRVSMISFTGSPLVGWELKARAPKKKVTLELGGNAAVIVCRDADVEYALGRIVTGAFGNAGQSCISVQRIYVHESIADSFIEGLVARALNLAVGDPFDEKTIVGPMIDEAAAVKAEEWLREAVEVGARVLTGGTRNAAVLRPTVLTNVNPSSRVSCQEVFAPIVTVDRFTDLQDAIDRVNDSAFGLQAGIFTNNAPDIFKAYRELEVGGVIVNDASSYRADQMPYGGVKDSGSGREGVRYAMEEMTEMKLLALNPG